MSNCAVNDCQKNLLEAEIRCLAEVLEEILHPDNSAIVYFVPSDAEAMRLQDKARAALGHYRLAATFPFAKD